jgi:tetratricopeptide (TPR) repeat protein
VSQVLGRFLLGIFREILGNGSGTVFSLPKGNWRRTAVLKKIDLIHARYESDIRPSSPFRPLLRLNFLSDSKPWFLGLVLALLVAFPAFAQEARWKELNDKVLQLYQQGKYAQAILAAQEALRIARATFSPEHAEVLTSLNNLAMMYQEQGQYGAAEPVFKQALAIREKALGPEHPLVAQSLNNLAVLYYKQGQYDAAEPLYQRSLAIREKVLGPEHPDVAESLNNLAALYYTQSQYDAAEPLYKRSLAIREKALGPQDPLVAESLNNLAELYREEGKYGAAEPLYQRSLAIREKALGLEHPLVAQSLNNLALLYQAQNQYGLAEPLFKQALAVREKTLGPEHPDVAQALNNLAALYQAQNRYGLAESLFKQALAIRQKALGPEHRDVAEALNNLADLYLEQHQYGAAEPLFKQALAISEKALGPEHPLVATALNNLGDLYREQGLYSKAEPLYKRAVAIWEKTLGPDHPDSGTALLSLAMLYYAWGRPRDADAVFELAFQNLGKQFEQHFSYMSERERLAFLSTVFYAFPVYFSFVLTYKDQEPGLTEKMYDRLLWEKGLVVGSVTAERTRIAASGDQQALVMFDQLAAKKSQLAALVNITPSDREQWRRNLALLEQESNEQEKELARRSASFAEDKKLLRPSWEQVRGALKEGEAAVEFVRFWFSDGKKWTNKSYYAALVVRRESARPQFVTLGQAEELEAGPLEDYRGWVAEPDPAEAQRPNAGRKFTEGFWQPLERALGTAKRVYVSPDGVLNEVALGVIPLADGELLMDSYDLRLVSSTKELLQSGRRTAPNSAVLIGNPTFELSATGRRVALASLDKPRERENRAQAGSRSGFAFDLFGQPAVPRSARPAEKPKLS